MGATAGVRNANELGLKTFNSMSCKQTTDLPAQLQILGNEN